MFPYWEIDERRTAREDIFLRISSLELENKALRSEVESFRSGKRFLKIQDDYKRVIAGCQKEIRTLKTKLARAHEETVTVRDIWFSQCDEIVSEDKKLVEKLNQKIDALEKEKWEICRQYDEERDKLNSEHKEELAEKDAIIDKLKQELAHVHALLGRDGSNTGLPTSQTPVGKKKRVPNTRVKGTRPKGGQPGHPKHEMEKPSPDEINDVVDHELEEGELCPECGSDDLKYTGHCEKWFEVDVEINVIKRQHNIWEYICMSCGEIIYAPTPPNLRAECQYGPYVQACALSLMNNVNAAINKVPMFLSGLTGGEVHPCEGYIAKVQARAAKALQPFRADLISAVVELMIIYWDDTVVMISQKRGCLRFYGDERIALYIAHEKKDLEGILEDGVLEALTEAQRVMHDHNSINYNVRFRFQNIECIIHFQRDTQKLIDETGHAELIEMKERINTTLDDRSALLAEGKTSFTPEYIEEFNDAMTDIINRAEETANANGSIYTGDSERALIRRLKKHYDNYFAWVKDFTLPTTNNLAERALRGIKSKMKISGQFDSVCTADNYALVKSYVETARRCGVNEMAALVRLCEGNPYTVQELLSQNPP